MITLRPLGPSVLFTDEEVLLAFNVDLGAGILAEQHLVALLHGERDGIAVVVGLTRADGNDPALLGLLLGGIGDDDSALALLFLVHTCDENAVPKRT
jgi:hypothetical protein